VAVSGLVIVRRTDLLEQRRAIACNDGALSAVGHRGASRQGLGAVGWHIKLEMEGWQTLAPIC
jgi:hypothetical protein